MSQVLKLLVFLLLVIRVRSQGDPSEVCLGLEDQELVGFGQDVSCTGYFACEGEYGYEEDCVELYGEEYEFNYETNQCDFYDVVNCAALDPNPIDPDPPGPAPPPETPAPPVVTETPAPPPDTTDVSVPDITCPTNKPGEIIFFESSNCTEYFICANGVRMRMVCMEGFTWNQDDRQCDYPIFSRCSSNIATDGLNVRCTRTGFYSTAYPRNCEKFVFCSAGIPIVQNCPIGHAWHIDRCVARQFASCPDLLVRKLI